MGDLLACLRGWHPALAKAELSALLPEADLSPTPSARWWRVGGVEKLEGLEALDVASGLQCYLVDGVVTAVEETDQTAWLETVRTYLDHHPVSGLSLIHI